MSSAPIPIIALDVPGLAEAKALVAKLGPAPDFYKVGLQLFSREGPAVVEWLRGESKRVFLDLKLHDIPNTVRGAAASAAALGVELLTVHAMGGESMVRAAVEGASGAVRPVGAESAPPTGILAVTVLTSFNATGYSRAIGLPRADLSETVLRFADIAAQSGARGVVCAAAEAIGVRQRYGAALGTLVPGLRLEGMSADDQARVSTPAQVRDAGATWVVVGRAVTAAANPTVAFRDLQKALAG